MPARREQLDSRIRVITPENIAFEYRLAGPFWRLPAYLIDLGIRITVFAIISFATTITMALMGLGSLGIVFVLLSWFVLAWFYGGLFETFWNGQTPGKRVMQLRVISADGRPINGLQAVLRNVLRVVDALPGFPLGGYVLSPTYLTGLVAASCLPRYQRLGDLACGTIVVIEERSGMRGVERVEGKAIDLVQAQMPASWMPSRSLAAALSKYVERRRFFGPARRAEIARHVASVLIPRLGLPEDTDHDALLCAAYRRWSLSEQADEEEMSRRDFSGGNGREAAVPVAEPAAPDAELVSTAVSRS